MCEAQFNGKVIEIDVSGETGILPDVTSKELKDLIPEYQSTMDGLLLRYAPFTDGPLFLYLEGMWDQVEQENGGD